MAIRNTPSEKINLWARQGRYGRHCLCSTGEIAEEEGIVRERGRKPYLEEWEIAALLELAAAFEIPATTLAQMIIGPHIRSYHIFRKDSGEPESYERTVYGVLLIVEDKGFQEPIPSGAAQREVLIADRGEEN